MATKKQKPDIEEAALAVLDATPDGDGPLDPDAVLDGNGHKIPEDLQFSTEGKPLRKPAADDTIRFDVDGATLTAVRPAPGAWTLILSGMSDAADAADRTHAILSFIYNALDEPSSMLLKARMLNRHDPFDIDDLANIVKTLIRKWAPANRAERRANKTR